MNSISLMQEKNLSKRSLYIWGPRLTFLGYYNEIGPLELWELTSLVEAFVFAERLAAHTVSNTLDVWDTFKDLGEDFILTDIVYEAQKLANLDSDSALVQWEMGQRNSSNDASATGRVTDLLKQFNRGETFINATGIDEEKFFSHFIQSGFDISPSPEGAVPFLAGLRILQPEKMLLTSMDARLKEKLDVLAPLLQSRVIYVPPLLAILLSRCKTQDDIPMNLVRLRKDFKEIRETLTKYRGRLVNANNIGDQLEAVRDLEQAMAEVSKRIVRAEGGHITSSIIRRFWDSAREGNWMKLLSEPIDLLWERIETHGSAQLATHFVDIYRQFRNIPDYYNLLVRVFGEVDYKAFELYSPVQN